MKYFLFCLLIILLGTNIYAQQNYFTKRFDFGQSTGEEGSSIISTDSGSLVLFNTYSPGGTGLLESGLLFLSDTGNIQQYTLYSIPYNFIWSGAHGNLIKQPNKGLVAGGTLEDTIQYDAMLMKFDSLQDTLWMRVYGDSLFQSTLMVRQTEDHGYVLIGQTATFDPLGDLLLIKTDSNGVEQWQKHYGGPFYEAGTCMDTCFDGGMILGGYTLSYGVGAGSHFGNAYAIKTDSSGIIQWHREFGDIYDDCFWNCFQSKDGNYVFAGFYTYYDPYYPSACCFSNSKLYIVKLDTGGTTVWEKMYGEINIGNYISSIKELPNGDIIAAGTASYYAPPINQFRGIILKVNSQGDSLWHYSYNGLNGNQSDSYLYDIAPSNDGGFVATGTVNPHPPDTGNQDIWVLKVDSNGCEVVNCVITGMQQLQIKEDEIRIYPNPSAGIFYLDNNSNNEIEITEVYNTLGEKVFYKKGITEAIDITNSPAGIYFYLLRTGEGKICKGEIVKE